MADPWEKHIQAARAAPEPSRWVRASSVPRFFACASSEADTEAPFNPTSDAAEMGRGNHLAIEHTVRGEVPNLAQIAEDHGIELAGLVETHRNAVAIWEKLEPYFGAGTKAEMRLEGAFTGGTADLIEADADHIAILDWKFGSVRRAYRPQVLAYGQAAVDSFGWPASGQIDCWIAYPRLSEEPDYFAVLPEDLEAFRRRWAEQERSIGKQYAPGESCGYCRRKLECRAREDYTRTAASSLTVIDADTMTAQDLAKLYPQAQMLEKALAHYKAVLRDLVAEAGALDTGDGKTLKLVEVTKESLDPELAEDVAKNLLGLSDDNFRATLTVSKAKLIKAVKDRAPRGKKEDAAKQAMGALNEAGAVRRFTYTKLQQYK